DFLISRSAKAGFCEIPCVAVTPLISIADERKRERILTRDEELRLLAACENRYQKHLRPILICALDTGMRRGEIFGLKWSDVDFEERILTIRPFNTKTMKDR